MVFCDQCNICVHQACYGITHIPAGQWLCRTCSLGTQPKCELCPNRGGAMKSTKSGQKWAHVSCALWIPEVSIGCVEKMEPITKISSIPVSKKAMQVQAQLSLAWVFKTLCIAKLHKTCCYYHSSISRLLSLKLEAEVEFCAGMRMLLL